jgi:hypothetical protein
MSALWALLGRIALAPMLTIYPAVTAAASEEICRELNRSLESELKDAARVETMGLSFFVPSGMAKETLDSPDSEGYAWKGAWLEIVYSSGTLKPVDPRDLEESGCDIEQGKDVRRVLLVEPDASSIVAVFPDGYDEDRFHAIKVESQNRKQQLRVLRKV